MSDESTKIRITSEEVERVILPNPAPQQYSQHIQSERPRVTAESRPRRPARVRKVAGAS